MDGSNGSPGRSASFSGHRAIPRKDYALLWTALERLLEQLYREGFRTFYTGGALGFDTMAAQQVLRLRLRHPDVRLQLLLPCPSQSASWPDSDRDTYDFIREQANGFLYLSKDYRPGIMQQRDRMLAEKADILVCYLTKKTGGTAYTVSLAEKRGILVINTAGMIAEGLEYAETEEC